jgi:hypothetical protein
MRTFALVLCVVLFLSASSAYSAREFPKAEAKQPTLTTEQFEHDLAELAAEQDHTDFYLVLRLEVSSLRREYPEHRPFLDQYLKQQLP